MTILSKLKFLFSATKSLSEWYFVTFDKDTVTLKANPPEKDAWRQTFHWKDIIRVCYKTEDFSISDGIYIFMNQRPESYVVPTEANGGTAFWGEILERKLFDAELAIKAATSTTSNLYCWPKDEDS